MLGNQPPLFCFLRFAACSPEGNKSLESFRLKVLPRRNNTLVAKPLDRIDELPDEDVRTV